MSRVGKCHQYKDRRVTFLGAVIWEYLRSKCSPFVAMNCNSQISEIFKKNAFYDLINDVDAESGIRELVSMFTYEAFCADFNESFTEENEVYVNYRALSDMIRCKSEH